MKKWFIIAVLILIAAAGCAVLMQGGQGSDELPTEAETEVPSENATEAWEIEVEALLNAMTLEEKICQMMFVTPESITGTSAVTRAGDTTRKALEAYPVGGIIYFAANLKSEEQVINMIENTQSYSKIPLFIGVDEEGGRVARLSNNPAMNMEKLPAMGDVKTTNEAYRIGQQLGKGLKDLCFNVDFAPVADVIVEGRNTEIGDRSFGTDPVWVSDCVREVVRGLEENNVLSVLKHFPGHGSTVTDSHTGYSASDRGIDELRECEFLPFKKGIEAGCGFVMVSHMTLVNAIEENVPASLSREVIEGFLKGELGFTGIVITDSLSMGAITKEYTNRDAAVRAVKAGADMLLMPKNVEDAKTALTEAVESGEITEDRIDESVRKILRVKFEKGLL